MNLPYSLVVFLEYVVLCRPTDKIHALVASMHLVA